jgi:phospholipid/cholesterol/gamma-HCH transport system substrate-binding protein
VLIGCVGVAVTAATVVGALQYDRLPFFRTGTEYSAFFAQAGGLGMGATVEVLGARAGQVTDVSLDGARVRVTFTVDRAIRLGDRSEAAIKTKTLLGNKFVEVTPRGDGQLAETIPLQRTSSPYQLADALGDLSTTVSRLDTDQLSDSLAVLADTFKGTPPDLQLAFDGVKRISQTLNARDQRLRDLLADARKATTVLAQRSTQIASLITNSDALLAELQSKSAALDEISGRITALSQQLSGFIAENRQLRPTLDKLNGVLTILDNRKAELRRSLTLLRQGAMSLGEAVSSGPFFKAYVANIIPGQFLQPFIDSAFSDLGVDPNVLLPSQLSDPETGQSATPALPGPYPRTGQGGPPRLTLPDAITGQPGDPRYPYREPPPAPPPGGPPPGPPALSPNSDTSIPPPSPSPIPAPAEASGAPQ